MTALPVEAVLVIFYGPEAHHVTYGRQVDGGGYTKDYIQLYRTPAFLGWAQSVFPLPSGASGAVPLTFEWPGGSVPGDFIYRSSDRPHLKWDTATEAPRAWRMAPATSDLTVETIPGTPGLTQVAQANAQYDNLAALGAGRPYLLAVKLREPSSRLHVRAYLSGASPAFSWADLSLTPPGIQALAARTQQSRALAWELFSSRGTAPTPAVESALRALADGKGLDAAVPADVRGDLARYITDPGVGLFFDPDKNHDAWTQAAPLPQVVADSAASIVESLILQPMDSDDDFLAETLPTEPAELASYRGQLSTGDYRVDDATSTTKTRGSAQRVFAEAVKSNYGGRCAITGISTREFLVASHIVPWSSDATIRLDPANGICLSLLVDRAFEAGYLSIEDDLVIHVHGDRIGADAALFEVLQPFEGRKLTEPSRDAPKADYLSRRRRMFTDD
jgi:hypothetical protein